MDNDKKNSLLYMVLVLTLITFISAAGLSYVNGIVQEPIRISQEKETLTAIGQVLPEYDNNPFEDKYVMKYEGRDINVYIGRKDGNMTGLAFEISSNSGYGGKMTIMAGINTSSSTVNGMYVLSHAETPGLGDKMRDKEWQDKELKGKPVSSDYKYNVVKDGGEIHALTAATITSRAVCEAFNTVYPLYSEFLKQQESHAGQDEDEIPETDVLPSEETPQDTVTEAEMPAEEIMESESGKEE